MKSTLRKVLIMYRKLLLLLIPLVALFGCKSAPDPIPDDVTPAVLLQMAQASILKDNNNDNAVYYYTEFLNRFPDETQKVVEAEYEIAFIHYKEKDYDTSKKLFEEIVAKYQGPNGDLLPRWPLVLTNKILPEVNRIIEERDARLAEKIAKKEAKEKAKQEKKAAAEDEE